MIVATLTRRFDLLGCPVILRVEDETHSAVMRDVSGPSDVSDGTGCVDAALVNASINHFAKHQHFYRSTKK
jgi:hypothetical protein